MSQAEAFRQHLNVSGFLSEERLAQLCGDIRTLEKVASAQSALQFLRSSLPALTAILATGAVTSGMAYLGAKGKYDEEQKRLQGSFDSLSAHPEFKKDPLGFNQRFHELSLISPVVASSPQLAKKIIVSRLKKGFDLDDAHRLSAIEYHSGLAPKVQHPMNAAKAQALVGAGNALNYILPSLSVQQSMPAFARSLMGVKELTEEQKAQLEDYYHQLEATDPLHHASRLIDAFEQEDKSEWTDEIYKKKENKYRSMLGTALKMHNEVMANHPANKMKGTPAYGEVLKKARVGDAQKTADLRHIFNNHFKKSTINKEGSPMMKVSEECLGKMLADTHLLAKEAGVMASVGKFLQPSANNMKTYLQGMMIPLSLAVGYGAIQTYMDSRKKKEMVAEANRVYASLSRTSEVISGNKEIADQAFDSLRSFAPALAAKPIIARTFIENVVNGQGHIDPNTANMLATTQQAIQTMEKRPGGGFFAGLKEPMSLFSHKGPSDVSQKK